jgi:hypothetical protein
LVVRELIGVTSLALHKGAARTYTNEGTQRYERSTIVTFVISHGEKIKNPSQRSPELAMNNDHRKWP